MAKVNYTIKIIPIGDSRTEFNIDNTTLKPTIDHYGIDNLNITYSILNPQQNMARIILLDIFACRNNKGYSNIDNDIRKGDIVQIYENNAVIQTLIFIGYIYKLDVFTAIENDYIKIDCFNLLQQLSMQNIIKPIITIEQLNQDSNHELTEWLAPNISTLENTLNNIFKGTLIQFAYEQQYINEIGGVTNKNNPYAFVNASGNLKNALSLNNKVIIALSPTMKKTEALTNLLQIYQYIYYQDQYGVVRIQPLSIKNQANSLYNFSLEKANNYTPYESVLFNNNITLNEVVVTGVNAGALDLEISSLAKVQPGLFQREYDLLQTGNFTNLGIDVQNLPTEVTQNPTTLNIWYNTNGKGNPYIKPENSVVTSTKTTLNGGKPVNQVLQLISTRELCQSLMNDTTITVNTKRDFTIGVELPFGKMISFNSAGRTSKEFNQGLCIGCNLTFANNETNLSYQIIKPYTIVSIWD